jgi:hypothetical protein
MKQISGCMVSILLLISTGAATRVQQQNTTAKSSEHQRATTSPGRKADLSQVPPICIVNGGTNNHAPDDQLFNASELFAAAVAGKLQASSILASAGVRFRPVGLTRYPEGCARFVESVPEIYKVGDGFSIILHFSVARELKGTERDLSMAEQSHLRTLWGTTISAVFTTATLNDVATKEAERVARLLLRNLR